MIDKPATSPITYQQCMNCGYVEEMSGQCSVCDSIGDFHTWTPSAHFHGLCQECGNWKQVALVHVPLVGERWQVCKSCERALGGMAK